MADELWPILLLVTILLLTGTQGVVVGAFGDAIHIPCPDSSNPFSGALWWC